MATLFQHAIDDQRFALVVLQMLTRADSPQPAVCVVHEGIPVPKGRPRFTRKGIAFTPARTKTAEKDLAWTLKAHVRQRPMVGPLALVAMFYVPDQRRTDADVAGAGVNGEAQCCTQCDAILIEGGLDPNYYTPGVLVGVDCRPKKPEPSHHYPKRGRRKKAETTEATE